MRLEPKYACAWALALLSLGGCQASSGSFASWYFGQSTDVVAVPSIPGTVSAVVGGSQTLNVAFSTNASQRISDLTIAGGLSFPSGWSGPRSFSCSQLARDVLCELTLTYTPTASSSGTLVLTYSYTDQGGRTHSGTLRIPYGTSTNNNIVATASPSGEINAVIGAGSQSVEVTFTADDGNPVSNFSVTSTLGSLPSGWSSSASSFSCASVSTGNGCELGLSYAPTAVGSGTLTLNYSYTDNAGIEKSGTLNIPYASSSSNSVVGTASPSGQIAVTVNASQAVAVTFDTNDGNPATNLSVTSDLSSLPSGWSSSAGSFSCASLSTGNGCQLSLTYAPTAVGSGSVTLQFSYTNDAGAVKSGQVTIPYIATANDNVIGTASPSGQVTAVIGAGSQAVSITFTTDDGNAASGLSVTTNLSSLPSGWSSGAGSFSCASVSTGNSCQLGLIYAPGAVGSGTLNLSYRYINDAGIARTGTVTIPYAATTHDDVIGTTSPSGQVAVTVNGSQGVSVTFDTDDGNAATGLSITTNLASLPSGWTSGSGASFSCGAVSTGNGCQLSLTYAPTATAAGTLTLNYSYTDDAGSAKSGTVSIPYSASTNDNVIDTVAPSGTVTSVVNSSQAVSITFDADDGNTATGLAITSNLASLPNGWTSGSGASFSCAAVSTGNGCQLSLTYAPTAVGSGTLSLQFSYTNNAGTTKSGFISIPYTASTDDNVIGTASPSGQINAVIGAGDQSVTVTFTTDDGNAASGLSVTTNLTSLPNGWSASSGSFSCASVSTGNSCQLGLTYAPGAVGSGTLNLNYSYVDDAGNAKSGAVSIPYAASTHDSIVGTAAPSGQIAVPVNASQGVSVTFDTDDANTATNLSIASDLASLPSGWSSGSASFSCASVSTGNACQLSLTYAPTAAASGTLTLNYSYLDDAGSAKSGTVSIPYIGTTNDNVIDTVAPSGTVTSVVNASQGVTVTFDTDDGNTATGLAITSNLASLPSGWTSGSGASFSCASVSTGNGCQLSLTYAPTSVASGTLTINFSYTNNAGTAKTGYITIPYLGTAHDNVIGTVAPSGQIAVTVNGSQTVSVTFDTDDGNVATGLSITTNLASLPSGWTSGSGASFSCASVSTGNACQLSLTYAPTAVASGTLNVSYSYLDDAGSAKSGTVSIPYTATTNNHLTGTVAPSGTVTTVLNSSQGVTVTFTTDDGNPATNLSVTSNLSSLPSGWSSGSGSFSCASVSTGTGCQLSLTFDPSVAGGSTLSLSYSYTNNAGTSQSGTVNIPYLATTNDTVIGTAAPSGTVNVAVNASQGVTVTFTSSDGNIAIALSVTSNLASLPSGWTSGSGSSFSCASVSTGSGCQLSLAYAPTVAANATLTLNYSYTNNAGDSESGSVSIPYTSNATIGGTVTGLNGTVVLQDNGADNLSLSANGAFTFATALASGATYNVTVLSQPTGQTCTVSSGSGTVSTDVTSVTVSCTTNTYSVGGSVSGLSASGLALTDNGGDTLQVSSTATSFTFATPLAYGATYSVAVGTQPTGQTCTVSSGSGTVTGTVTSVSISCTTNTYSIGGTISGLSANGLALTDNGGNFLSLASGTTSFAFTIPLSYGATYAVAVSTQPTGQACTVSNGSGTVTGAVTSVSINCVTTYTIGGTISGLTQSSVVLATGSQTVTVSSGASSWVFPTAVVSGTAYAVTVQTQPIGEVCNVTSGSSGTVSGANVSNVTVLCGFAIWTWEGGSNSTSANGVYGTKSTASASNAPGAREYPVTWTDASGNLWLFGGWGYATSGCCGQLNDLWKYSPSSGEWTWVSGSSSAEGSAVYGTKGVAGAGNTPGAREASVSWIDSSGNLWLFGGASVGGSAVLNDLWEYTPSSGEWTWVSGSSGSGATGVYGTKGAASAGNVPGAREDAVSWIDSSGNLWLFGGDGYGASGSEGSLNDLWEYSPSSGEWTWVSGGSSIGSIGVYGTEGTASSSNVPGTRQWSVSWIDSSGNLWLFGGWGYSASGCCGQLNDLWKYSPSSGEWTWESGSSSAEAAAVYGTQGAAAASNVPGAREASVSWIDSSGNLWLFGGASVGGSAVLNDLWEYTPSSGEWAWMSGSNSTGADGVYGTRGTAAASNVPGARDDAAAWVDASGHLWLLGGNGYGASGSAGTLNDLWQADIP